MWKNTVVKQKPYEETYSNQQCFKEKNYKAK
jgi:hypothetical protein